MPHQGHPRLRHWQLLLFALPVIVDSGLSAADLPANMDSWSPIDRNAAAHRAAQAGPTALPDLLVALGSNDKGMRHASTEAIGLIAKKAGDTSSKEWQDITAKLIRMAATDEDFWTRCGALSTLKIMRPPAATPVLIKSATDPNPWVAAAAVNAISGMPMSMFDPNDYLATAIASLGAPRSETRSSAIKMIGRLGDAGKKSMPAMEKSVSTFSQDSMFADRPRIEAIIWISQFDPRKAASLANDLLLEDRWGTSGRYSKLLPFLDKLGPDAAPAIEGVREAATQKRDKDKRNAALAKKILNNLKK